MIGPGEITALVLAGGRGTRMGGLDKGLQSLAGQPLVQRALDRLQAQLGNLIGPCMLNANRHLDRYAAFGVPVCPDALTGYVGPLAGIQAGLQHCETPWLLVVPCDCPRFPLDLAQRLARALTAANADLAVAAGRDDNGAIRTQPVFSLLRSDLLASLASYTAGGGRKVGHWASLQRMVTEPFDQPGDDPRAFFNANTLADLDQLEQDTDLSDR